MKAKLLIPICCLALFVSCGKIENKSKSGSRLILSSLTGTGENGQTGSTVVFCDVLTGGAFVNDNGTAAMLAKPLDVNAEPTYNHSIIVDQIDVEYSRPGTASVQGVDVPYSFSLPLNIMIDAALTSPTEIGFVLVTQLAKTQPPLFDLINSGQLIMLVAKITVHGTDVAGYRVAPVSGDLTMYCADFVD